MKDSVVSGWRSTVLGVAVLAFTAFLCWRNPALASNPSALVPLLAGLYSIFGSKL